MKCIVPCAGESSRMSFMPKHLISIKGKPLLLHVLEPWKDEVDSFIFVIKRSMIYMYELFPKNSIIVFQDEPKGLADAIYQARNCFSVREPLMVVLGDCLHRGQFNFADVPAGSLGIGVWPTTNLKEVNKSYLVEGIEGAMHLVEKPNIPNNIQGAFSCGMGVYFLDARIFTWIESSSNLLGGGGDLTCILQKMIDTGIRIAPIPFTGKYVNVSSPEDLERVEEILSG